MKLRSLLLVPAIGIAGPFSASMSNHAALSSASVIIAVALDTPNCGECVGCEGKGHAVTKGQVSTHNTVGLHECNGPGNPENCSVHGTCGTGGGGQIPEGEPQPDLEDEINAIVSITLEDAREITAIVGERAWINTERNALQRAGCTPGSVSHSIPIEPYPSGHR
jgi:hypothetical protein